MNEVMSLVFVCIVERRRVYFGRLHWRQLAKNPKASLQTCPFDEGYVFIDRNSGMIINEQSCVSLSPNAIDETADDESEGDDCGDDDQ